MMLTVRLQGRGNHKKSRSTYSQKHHCSRRSQINQLTQQAVCENTTQETLRNEDQKQYRKNGMHRTQYNHKKEDCRKLKQMFN